ncbi:ECF-type riboflavin transporter substrate-binding protein [Clostridium sp.]|uniref:ECF-type riboflavin transporter substrate-binding protein n=1 Tax=Clostridium sp. TaxID=1506 RepID=UPI0026085D14
MKKNKLSIKTIVAIGIGSAVFMILGRFGSLPTGIPNTNIETAYAFLALMALLYGPLAGFLIGFIGHALKDIVFFGSPWISWVFASGIVGLIIGLGARFIKINQGIFKFKQIFIFNLIQIIANGVAWFLVAPTLDILIYSEPANKVYLQGIIGGISNMVTVGVLGTILIANYAKTRIPKGSLRKEY